MFRVTARLDVLGLLDRCVGYAIDAWRVLSTRTRDGSVVAWDDVPTLALVMTLDEPPASDYTRVDRFLLRSSPDRGVVVGAVDRDKLAVVRAVVDGVATIHQLWRHDVIGAVDRDKLARVLVDDDLAHLESELWSGLRLRRGSPRVAVLARRVSRDATADEMLELIRRGLRRLERGES